jgi:hypothetical protein
LTPRAQGTLQNWNAAAASGNRDVGSLNRPDDPIPDNYTERQALPVPVKVDRLGVGSNAVATPDVPQYPEMLAYLCERAGWDPERFEVFRCRVQYPILNSVVAVRFQLPH